MRPLVVFLKSFSNLLIQNETKMTIATLKRALIGLIHLEAYSECL
jgi:hypothetical protein